MERDGLQAAEAAVTVEGTGQVTLILENHRCEPTSLEEVLILGNVQELSQVMEKSAELCPEPSVNAFLPSTVGGSLSTESSRCQQISEALSLERSELSEAESEQLRSLVMEYADQFALNPFELGQTRVVEHTIDTGDQPPIRQPPRRVPHALWEKVTDMVQQMLDQGVIVPSQSPWSSPVVLVQKKDGSLRFCIDYRRLNASTKLDVFPLPRIEDSLDMLAKSKYFTTLDLATGYWQVPMEASSKEKTAFITYEGHYEFTVMPFGLTNAPATFQRLMEGVLQGLTRKSCLVYIDDILVTGKTLPNTWRISGKYWKD